MSTRGFGRAAGLAAASALARRHRNAVRAHTETLIDLGSAESEDFERYHMAWLYDQALTGIAPPELLMASSSDEHRLEWPGDRHPTVERREKSASPSFVVWRWRWELSMLAVLDLIVFGVVLCALLDIGLRPLVIVLAVFIMAIGSALTVLRPVELFARDLRPLSAPLNWSGASSRSFEVPGRSVRLPFDPNCGERRLGRILSWAFAWTLTAVDNLVAIAILVVAAPRIARSTVIGSSLHPDHLLGSGDVDRTGCGGDTPTTSTTARPSLNTAASDAIASSTVPADVVVSPVASVVEGGGHARHRAWGSKPTTRSVSHPVATVERGAAVVLV